MPIETINSDITIISNIFESKIFHIKENCTVNFIVLATKSTGKKEKMEFHFEGPRSTLNFLGIIIGKKDQEFPIETISIHKATNTKAHYTIKTVLFDNSKVDYKGTLVIKKTAQSANAYLEHHTLMLSEKAGTKTEPCLEIEADEVKAGHAATIGQIDDDLLFYLKSRGINEENSKKILIEGFLESDLSKFNDKGIEKSLIQQIKEQL
jgi:Fe-S cluster assembly protein SufD